MLEEVQSMTQVKKESYREVDTSIGTYECLARIIELQGYQVDPEGPPSADAGMQRGAFR